MNNILTGNMAGSNDKKNIHLADPANNTIHTDLSQESDSAQELLFWDSILPLTTIITVAFTTLKKMREDQA
jgi:hypothetical protein